MCGRYYIDDETAREMEKLVREINEKLVRQKKTEQQFKKNRGVVRPISQQEVYPTYKAPIILEREGWMSADEISWGIPYKGTTNILFNARSESAFEKELFQESMQKSRCIIPMKGFYEWNQQKDKYYFQGKDREKILYVCGFYKKNMEKDQFVILTKTADHSVKAVHHRMPCRIQEQEVEKWIFSRNTKEIKEMLLKENPELEKKNCGQMNLLDFLNE